MKISNVFKMTILFILFSVVAATAGAYSLDARWRMDDNTTNATVIGNSSDRNGTFNSGSTTMNTTLAHSPDASEGTGALTFDGVDDYIQVYGYKGIDGTTSRTCTAWVKTTASYQGAIVCWGTSTTGQKWILRIESGGALGVGIYGGWIKTTATPLGDNTWHHVAAVLNSDGTPNSNEILLYIDGVQQTTTASPVDIYTGSVQDVMIGSHREDINGGGTPNMYFKGQLDDVHIYNYALSADEILEIKTWGPSPNNNATQIAIDSSLNWIGQTNALSYDVYFGTDESAVVGAQRHLGDINGDGTINIDDLSILGAQWLTNPGLVNQTADIVPNNTVDFEDFSALALDWGLSSNATFKGNQAGISYDPGALAYDTTYYWRVDKVDASGTTPGTVWNFGTESMAASEPSPANGATNVPIDTSLSWTTGLGAYYHEVYFGTDSTPDTTEYKGIQYQTSYDPGLLAGNTTYYWRIDEVNASGTTPGTVWSFTTSDRLPAELFPIIPWTEPWRSWGPADSIPVFTEIYDCGFNVADFVTPSGLNIAAATGLKGIVFDSSLHVLNDTNWDQTTCNQKALAAVNSYGNHSALFGYYLRDEPSSVLYPTIGRLTSAFRTYDSQHLSYVNLFPNYANSTQMGVSTYQQYVDSYVSTVQPDYISYDNYAYTNSLYWSNLVTIRTAAKNAGIPFWNIVQSVKVSSSTITPSPATLRFQLYTSLAYGARGIGWYLYFCWPPDLGNHTLAPIDPDGNKTATWYYLRDVNLAMHKIGPVYLTLNNMGYYHGSSPSGWSISGSDLLVGDFDQIGTGQSFVMVVNKSLTSTRNYTVSESLPGSVYYVSPADGQLYPLSGTLTLSPGEGRLLTVVQ